MRGAPVPFSASSRALIVGSTSSTRGSWCSGKQGGGGTALLLPLLPCAAALATPPLLLALETSGGIIQAETEAIKLSGLLSRMASQSVW